METTRSFHGVDSTVLSQLKAARAATSVLAEERRFAEESAQQYIEKSEAALREAFEMQDQKEEMATSSNAPYGLTSSAQATSHGKEIEEVSIPTPDSEGLGEGTVLNFDNSGLVATEDSGAHLSQRMLRQKQERRIDLWRPWRSGDVGKLLESLVSAVLGCFHGLLRMISMRRSSIADEATPLVSKAEV